MTESYFSREPIEVGDLRQFALEYGGRTHLWTSSRGVFARDRLDVGSRLLLDCLEGREAEVLLDLGCGTGPLALLHLLRQGRGRAVLVDVNPRACHAARINLDRLGVSAWVVQGDGGGMVRDRSIDLVVSNPPIRAGLAVIEAMWADAARVLRPGGELVFVGRPKQGGRRLADKAAAQLGGEPEKLGRNKGFEVFAFRRGDR